MRGREAVQGKRERSIACTSFRGELDGLLEIKRGIMLHGERREETWQQ
jgi:hypothetical protein